MKRLLGVDSVSQIKRAIELDQIADRIRHSRARNRQRYYLLVIIIISILFSLQLLTRQAVTSIGIIEALDLVSNDVPTRVDIYSDRFQLISTDGNVTAVTYISTDTNYLPELIQEARKNGIELRFISPSVSEVVLAPVLLLLTIGVVLVLLYRIGIWPNILRSVNKIPVTERSYRTNARVVRDMERPQVTFRDVVIPTEAKKQLVSFVRFLREPDIYIRMGARIQHGFLLVGPSGMGKTLSARAIAGEAGVPFFYTHASDFAQPQAGSGVARMRDLFDRAKAEAPSIVFFDSIDILARPRIGSFDSPIAEEMLHAFTQLVNELDGFEQGTNVVVFGATDRISAVDSQLLRAGRLEVIIKLDYPDTATRLELLKLYSRGKPLAQDVDLQQIAAATEHFTGADIELITNEAALLAAESNRKSINMESLHIAVQKITPDVDYRYKNQSK